MIDTSFLTTKSPKRVEILFGEKNLTNESIYYEQFALTESICTDSQLKFGGCESNMLEFRITNRLDGNTIENLKGQTLEVKLKAEGANQAYIGTFKVYSDKLSVDNDYRDIVAYDAMYDILNINVAEWYNGVIFPIAIRDFRNAFFEYLQIEQQTVDLPNDDALIQISPYSDKIYAGDILKDICELNACFGIMNRYGVFEYRFLKSDIDYEISTDYYQRGAIQCEDFEFVKIGGVILRQNGSDTETIFTVERNPYTVETRVLYFGEDSTALNTICSNMYNILYKIKYTPFSVNCVGNPYAECGTHIEVTARGGQKINSYILSRKMSGIQKLDDEYSADSIPDFTYSRNTDTAGNLSSSIISAIKKDSFFERTFVNSLEYVLKQDNVTIIQFNIAGSQNADVIFMATIPIYADYDGNLALTYTIDAVEQKYSAISKYINVGYNVITIVNHFKLDESARMTLNVKARIDYAESLERKQTARIAAIEKYIESGNYSVPVIDATLPVGKITREAIKAVIFAQGLVETAGWDGTVNVAQYFDSINFDSTFTHSNMQEQVIVNAQEPIANSTVNQKMSGIGIESDYNIVGIKETIGSKTVLECCYINTEYAPNYTYNSEYVDISENDFRLRSKWSFKSTEKPVDDGTMATVEIYSEDKAKIKSIETSESW